MPLGKLPVTATDITKASNGLACRARPPVEPASSLGKFPPFAAAVRLARPWNCAMSAIAVLLGAWLVTRQVPAAVLCAALACAALITAGGNTLNDYYDARSDRLNHPRRPIPSGHISCRAAVRLAWMELGIGVLAGTSIGIGCGLIALSAAGLLVAYEAAGLKNAGLPGNIAISLLTAMLFVMGGAAAGDAFLPIGLAALSFTATLGREVIKDIEDMTGDTLRRTFPMRVGVRRARLVAALLLGLAILMSPLPYLGGGLSSWYLPAIGLAMGVFACTIVALFRRPGLASVSAKMAMAAVLAAVWIGLVR